MSPEAAAVISRARRSFMVSIGLLIFGFMAVAGAVVYRTSGSSDKGSAYEVGALAVPAGAVVISAVPSDGMIAITYELSGVTKLRLVNGTTGAVIRDIGFVSE